MIVWARADRIKAEVADVTDEWLTRFRVTHLGDVKKLGPNQNARLLYRTSAVLAALDGDACNSQDVQR